MNLQHRLASSEEEKGNLNSRMQQLEGEMKGLQTSMEASMMNIIHGKILSATYAVQELKVKYFWRSRRTKKSWGAWRNY